MTEKIKTNFLTKITLFFAAAILSFYFNQHLIIPPAKAEESPTLQEDYEKYLKYDKYLKYQNAQKYNLYKEYEKYKKYKFNSSKERKTAKDRYDKYKLFKKNPARYSKYAVYYKDYKRYKKYKDYYEPVKDYKKYEKYEGYEDYDKEEYKNYGTAENKASYDRYVKATGEASANIGEADLGCGIKDKNNYCLGPEITVGLWSYTKDVLRNGDFKIEANKDYLIKNSSGETIATVDKETQTYVRYDSDNKFKVYHSVDTALYPTNLIYFEAADGDNSNIIFDVHKPSSSLDEYRGEIRLKLYDASGSSNDRIWVINALPLEQYVWGMGEIAGTGDEDHNRVMTTIFRTYGYWKIKFSTKYSAYGFKVDATAGSQLYYGYNWETGHPRIKKAAESTWGRLIMYLNDGGLNEVALTPYSSWTDGRTRSFKERWGSNDYPWCRSVKDSYGKHPSLSTATLEAAGNHMVGLSAHGSLKLATDYKKSWSWILNYYFYHINLRKAY